MRKKCSALIIGFGIFISILFSPMIQIAGIQDIQITVKPRRIGTKATYLVVMKLDKALEVHDWIKVTWPKEAKLPELPEDPIERTNELKRIIESIYIGASPCSACQGLPEINYRENSIKFNIHMELNPAIPGYEKVNLTITDRVGIVNPAIPGFYKLKISTAKEIETFVSETFEIVESHLGEPTGIPVVTPSPAGFFQNASYEIRFRVGRGGQMSFNQSRIRIRFPEEIRFAYDLDKIPVYSIKVNDKPNNNRFALSDQTITLITPVDVDNSGEVKVLFEKEFGLINPVESGTFFLEVSTSEDSLWVRSEPFQIEKQGSSLRIQPNKTNQRVDIQFVITLPSDLFDMNPLIVEFPDSFSIPMKINNNTILINNVPSQKITIQKNTIVIYPSRTTNKFTPLTIHIQKETEIRNPKTEGPIRLLYKTNQDSEYFFTDEVMIETATFEINLLEIEPSNASSTAKYKISFTVEFQEGLAKGDSLWIQFPNGTILPTQFDLSLVLLYGANPLSIQIYPSNLVEFQLPYSVRSEETLVLQIEKNIGIQNPPQYEEKTPFLAWFSANPNEKRTVYFQFNPPCPKTSISLTEGIQGKNNWYIQPPILHLSANQKEVKTYLYWNDEPEKELLYSQPEKLMPGQYISKLSFYSVGPYGTEEVQSVNIQIDTTKPIFTLQNPFKDTNNKTNKKELEWIGEANSEQLDKFFEKIQVYPSYITVNDQVFPIDESGHFSVQTKNQPGENTFFFKVEDAAGNFSTERRIVLAKFTPPSLSILSPALNATITTTYFKIIGKTDPQILVSYDNHTVEVDKDGKFSFPYPLTHFGKQKVELSALDEYGNTNILIHTFWFGVDLLLTINQKKTIVNEKEVILAYPPFIQSGRTFVPFRFLGEQLGATVQYTVDSKTKRVNTISYELENKRIILYLAKKTIQVNGTSYPLDPVPIIQNGTTFIPVRIVSEFMNCSVFWDQEKQQVRIEFPILEASS
ncbi:copper amine oxidase N-terminal domain-containing protein [bacterium]|nr:copper amine oxidase N-terminal domain-containing protein [bacterium]